MRLKKEGRAMNDNELQFDRRCHVLYSKPCQKQILRKIALHYPVERREAVWGQNSGNTRHISRTGAPIWAAKIIFTTAQAAPMTALP